MKLAQILRCTAIAAAIALAVPARAQAGGGRIISPRPVPPPGWVYRYVAPVYRTVMDQMWVAESRQLVPVWVETSPGCMEQAWREIVTPGRWMTTSRQELVAAGYYELVRVDPPVVIVPQPRIVFANPGSTGVEGYQTATGENLSQFSSLSEWPDKK
jgi:hypothetical protein